MARLGYFGLGHPNSTTPELIPLASPLPDLLIGLLIAFDGNAGIATGELSVGLENDGTGICSSPTFCGFNFGCSTGLGTVGVFFFSDGGMTALFFGGTILGGVALGGDDGASSVFGGNSLTNATSIILIGFAGLP